MGQALVHEARRQLFAKLLARTPLRNYTSLLYRLRSGHFFNNPRFLLSAIVGIVVVLGGAVMSCLGALTAFMASR
jgi:hypothetical protein